MELTEIERLISLSPILGLSYRDGYDLYDEDTGREREYYLMGYLIIMNKNYL